MWRTEFSSRITRAITKMERAIFWATGRNHIQNDPLAGKEFGNTPEALLFNNCVYAMDLRNFIEVAKILEKPDEASPLMASGWKT